MIPVGGVKLGGGGAVKPNVDPREAARRAAEKRMEETMEFSKKFGLDLDSEIVAIDSISSDDEEEEEEEGEKKKKKDVVVIDLLSSSDEEKEDAKENKRKLTGKHLKAGVDEIEKVIMRLEKIKSALISAGNNLNYSFTFQN